MSTYPSKTIFVTGAAGFIGFHLSKRLLESGVRIIGFDNINSYYDPSLKHARLDILQKYPDFTFIKGDKRVADITFGDYWGCMEVDSFYNPAGVSVIFVHTEKGAALLEGVRDLKLTETEFEHASWANPMLFRSKAKSPQREVFVEMFAEKGLAAACRRSRTVKQRVLAVAGRWCPKWVKKAVMLVLRRR